VPINSLTGENMAKKEDVRSEEHTSELPTRRSSDLAIANAVAGSQLFTRS